MAGCSVGRELNRNVLSNGNSPDRPASALPVLLGLSLALVVVHTATNGAYGWHRDELATLDDARHLDWGFVAYPPLAPALARVGLELFGPSLAGVRLLSAVAQGVLLVLTGLMAREMGGYRHTQILAAVAAALAPIAILQGALFQYVSFDMLWWVTVAYFVLRLVNSDDPRWWLAIGAGVGIGMQTKYTMAFLAVGVVAGVLFTRTRRHLSSPWLWAGVAVSLAIFAPNLIWQIRNDFVSLDFLQAIHARDVRIGRTDGFLLEQLFVCVTPAAIALWAPGLVALAVSKRFERYRILAWLYVVPFLLLLVAQGRSYYLAPAYPMLIAAGSVLLQHARASWRPAVARLASAALWSGIAVGGVVFGSVGIPVAPVNSWLWNVSARAHDNFREQLGWPELVAEVARIYHALPAEERAVTGILANNYGEAGAINLFGPEHGLPEAICTVNSFWQRGYGSPPPTTLIVLGSRAEDLAEFFEHVEIAGHTPNPFGVENEETRDHPVIYLCRGMRRPWADVWAENRDFG